MRFRRLHKCKKFKPGKRAPFRHKGKWITPRVCVKCGIPVLRVDGVVDAEASLVVGA